MSQTILLIEDETEIRSLYKDYLESRGYKVFGFENSVDAKPHIDDIKPDLVVSGIMQPKQDGIEFLKEFKNNPKWEDIPYILLTAIDAQQVRDEAAQLGAAGYYTKQTTTPEQLVKIIYNALRIKTIPIDKIVPPKFGLPDNPEKDEKLIALLQKNSKHEIPVIEAIVDIDLIKPFCAYKPSKERLDSIKTLFANEWENGHPRFMITYEEDGRLIMSDDYYAYYYYLDAGFKKVPCYILGETTLPIERVGTGC